MCEHDKGRRRDLLGCINTKTMRCIKNKTVPVKRVREGGSIEM